MTEVMIEPAGFRKQQREQKLSYDPEEPLFKKRTPAICKGLEGGVIIDLGLTNVEEQLRRLVTVEALRPDHQLAEELEAAIVAQGGRSRGHRFDVLGSSLFRNAEPDVKEQLEAAVNGLTREGAAAKARLPKRLEKLAHKRALARQLLVGGMKPAVVASVSGLAIRAVYRTKADGLSGLRARGRPAKFRQNP